MRSALALAKKALTSGNPPVGAVLVWDDEIIGEGIESGKTTNNITNHAEILAIQDAIQKGYSDRLPGSTLYTTHEPCIMCSYVIRQHRIGQIIFGVPVDHVGGYSSEFKVLCTEVVPKWGKRPVIMTNVLADECLLLSAQYNAQQNERTDSKIP